MGKIVYAAEKSSYGMSFEGVYKSLQDLKNGIIQHEHGNWGDEDDEEIPYSEELAEKCIKGGQYTLYKIDLHDDEYISFSEYDGQTSFRIEKKVKNIHSTKTRIEL